VNVLQVFTPDVKDKRLADFKRRLLESPMYLQDEFRSPDMVEVLTRIMFLDPRNIFFEIGKWQGLVGFINILVGYKCSVAFKLWDKAVFGPTLVRELREASDAVMGSYRLKRMTTDTPDESMVKLAKMCGFKVESRQKYGFRWEGKLMTNFLLRKLDEEA